MPAHKGTQPPGGSRKGKPNKFTADVRAMIQAALDQAGGVEYLAEQAQANPGPFMALVGKIIPKEIVGAGGEPLIPPEAMDPTKIALALLSVLKPKG